MDIQTLTRFFKWCTIINGSLLILWAVLTAFAPQFLYQSQHAFVPLSQETFNTAIYALLGLFKILFLVFNFIPYLALRIIGCKNC